MGLDGRIASASEPTMELSGRNAWLARYQSLHEEVSITGMDSSLPGAELVEQLRVCSSRVSRAKVAANDYSKNSTP